MFEPKMMVFGQILADRRVQEGGIQEGFLVQKCYYAQ